MRWRPWTDLLELVELGAPSACAGCGQPRVRWCPGCEERMATAEPAAWSPTPRPAGMPPTWAGPAYAHEVRSGIVAWKDGGRADLTPMLGAHLRRVLGAALAASPEHLRAARGVGGCAVVPAPSSRASTRARGEHRMARLARAATSGQRGALPVLDVLRLRRRVADQAGLDAAARAANLAGAVLLRGPGPAVLQGRPCIVIDDVVTTGATLTECARALAEGGAGPVLAVALAATRRRSVAALPLRRAGD